MALKSATLRLLREFIAIFWLNRHFKCEQMDIVSVEEARKAVLAQLADKERALEAAKQEARQKSILQFQRVLV